jgi:hypothetical protein
MRLRAATLTLKNSSRLFEKIPKNFMRSVNGTVSSAASCNTLLLNDNQLISLLLYQTPLYCFISKKTKVMILYVAPY